MFIPLARRAEEPDAGTIAALYGVGLGLVAVSEFLMYLDLAFGWSLAAAFALSTGVVIFLALAAALHSCCRSERRVAIAMRTRHTDIQTE